MTTKQYLRSIDEEKAMRIAMYIARQVENCHEVKDAMSVYDLLNSDTDEIMIVAPENNERGYWFSPVQCSDIGCVSPFIDGDWGYYDPDNTELKFLFRNYGKTWAALPWNEAVDADGWPKVKSVVNKLRPAPARVEFAYILWEQNGEGGWDDIPISRESAVKAIKAGLKNRLEVIHIGGNKTCECIYNFDYKDGVLRTYSSNDIDDLPF